MQPGRWWGTLVLGDEQSVERIMGTYGAQQVKRTHVGNIRLFANGSGEDEVYDASDAESQVTSAVNAIERPAGKRRVDHIATIR